MDIKKAFLVCGLVLFGAFSIEEARAAEEVDRNMKLMSLKPEAVLDVIDLSRPGLEQVKTAADRGDRMGALSALLIYC